MKWIFAFIPVLLVVCLSCSHGDKQPVASAKNNQIQKDSVAIDDLGGLFLYYQIDPTQQNLQFFWKDDKGQILGRFQRLKHWLHQQDKQLIFAMNGGMYLKT